MSNTLPTAHTAGDTFAATLDGSTYPASGGWVAALVLIGAQRYTLSGSSSGADHAFAANSAATAAWAPGAYRLQAIYTRSGQRYSQAVGSLEVQPDPAAAGTTARALLSKSEQALQDLEALYRAYTTSGQFEVQEYEIAGRRMRFRDSGELLKALAAARRDVASERGAARASAGLSPRQTYVTRM